MGTLQSPNKLELAKRFLLNATLSPVTFANLAILVHIVAIRNTPVRGILSSVQSKLLFFLGFRRTKTGQAKLLYPTSVRRDFNRKKIS